MELRLGIEVDEDEARALRYVLADALDAFIRGPRSDAEAYVATSYPEKKGAEFREKVEQVARRVRIAQRLFDENDLARWVARDESEAEVQS